MRGVSAKSLADVVAGVDALDGDVARVVGDELFAVVGVLDSTPALRRVLTDPSTEADAKSGLATEVFGSRVDAATLTIVNAAVEGRWSSARDLADGLETAGVTAHVVAAQAAGTLDDLEDGLFEFNQIVADDAELRQVLTDRTVPSAPKATLIGTLLKDKATAAVAALAEQAVVARKGSFEKSIAEFAKVAAGRRDVLLAKVRVAYELDDTAKQRLADALRTKYGRDVHINTIVDPSVVGGISVAIGAEVIDGTVSSRLEDARRRIAG